MIKYMHGDTVSSFRSLLSIYMIVIRYIVH